MTTSSGLRKTPLHGLHREADARLVDFAGWEMPVQYTGVIEEHLAVRTRAGLFDVSHMGEVEIDGPGALDAVQRLTCNDASRLSVGQAQYSALTAPNGAAVDDILVYRTAESRFLLCVNAANDEKDFRWISENLAPRAQARHVSDEYAQMALQGPASVEIMAEVTAARVEGLAPFEFLEGEVAGSRAMISRTGYTGEDGFEIYCSPGSAPGIWRALMEKGKPRGLMPAGLGARDTLRLEACLALYGNDLDETTTLLEAGLGFIVKLDKGDFIGREPLLGQKRDGIKRKLSGFVMQERGVARHGYPVQIDARPVGSVSSGSYAPFLRKNLGLVYLPIGHARPGAAVDVIIRAKPVRAEVVRTPFYRRSQSS